MKQVIRAQYRAVLKQGISEEKFRQAAEVCRAKMEKEAEAENLLTGGIFRHENLLFLYMEYICDWEEHENREIKLARQDCIEKLPDKWFSCMSPFLHTWQELSGERCWAYMYPVFWFDTPKDLETWKRREKPDGRCGRIAVLYPDKLFSYVCHHQAIAEEGLLVGDRYQMISLHENLLFSYFETPRDREQVNIRRLDEASREIEKWEAADPESHFYHFPEARGENFLVIETVADVGVQD